MTQTYTAIYDYDPDDRAWIVEVAEEPRCHTWGRNLAQAKRNIRDALALWLDTDRHDLQVVDQVNPPASLAESVAQMHELRRAAQHAEQEAATATLSVAGQLRQAGLSMREASEVLGLSYQRIGQLAGGPPKKARASAETPQPEKRASA